MNIKSEIKRLTRLGVKKHGSVRAWLSYAGVAQSTFYRWLNGSTVPSLRTLQQLERVCK